MRTSVRRPTRTRRATSRSTPVRLRRVYGDYAKGFPPTLVVGGTRELFLSNFVRQYQAIEAAGGDATLDLYEGMPHMFHALRPDAAESRLAMRKIERFLASKLGD